LKIEILSSFSFHNSWKLQYLSYINLNLFLECNLSQIWISSHLATLNCPGSELKREEIEQLILHLLLARFLVNILFPWYWKLERFLVLKINCVYGRQGKTTSLHLKVKIKEQTLIDIYEDHAWVFWFFLSSTSEAKMYDHYWCPFVSLLFCYGTKKTELWVRDKSSKSL